MRRDYSATPLPKKLGIEARSRVALADAPDGFADVLEVVPASRGEIDVAILFATRLKELSRAFVPLVRRLAPSGGLWVAWPKKASGRETDLDFAAVQRVGLDAGLVDNKSCSIDDTWQALRFVIRLRDR
jgi:hypothetical protein